MGDSNQTSTGREKQPFPTTRWSALLDARDPNSPGYTQAMNHLAHGYWKPIYAYIRAVRALDQEQAKDYTQDFMVELIEGSLLTRYSPQRGNFRNYLKGALRLFLLSQNEKAKAQKRGGGKTLISLDDEIVYRIEKLAVEPSRSSEEALERQWALSVVEHAVEDLRTELGTSGKTVYFEVFDRYDLHPPKEGSPSYAQLAKDLHLEESDVTNYLRHCRQRLRQLLIRHIEDYVADESEIAAELEQLLTP